MRTFGQFLEAREEYQATREIAAFLIEVDADVDAFCGLLWEIAQKPNLTEEQLYNELWGGLGRLGAGLGGVASRLGGDIGRGIERGIDWAGEKLGQARDVGPSAWQGTKDYLRKSYEHGVNLHQQRQQVKTLDDITQRLQGIQQELFRTMNVTLNLNPVMRQINKIRTRVQGNVAYRFTPGVEPTTEPA